MPEKKSTSTLLDGNHAFPKFYACYLLRSVATANSQKTYVGSTPDPPRRLRQHNGELKQGAWKTSRGRPWEVQMIVYGFPSKLTALQFEWAWQHPFKSRHLRDAEGQIFKRDTALGRIPRRVLVAFALLRSNPFSHMPLHVRCFTPGAHDLFKGFIAEGEEPAAGTSNAEPVKGKGKGTSKGRTPKAGSAEDRLRSRMRSLPPLRSDIDISLDVRGMPRTFAARARKRAKAKNAETEAEDEEEPALQGSRVPLLDLDDAGVRTAAWEKWKDGVEMECILCPARVIEDHLTFSICADCMAVTHIPCLARASLLGDVLLPVAAPCPRCGHVVPWGQVVRDSYGRRDAARAERGGDDEIELEEKEEENEGADSDAGGLSDDPDELDDDEP